ncbi:MAG: TRAP transporter TatT component family protein, partial [Pseudomonadota bacterium]
ANQDDPETVRAGAPAYLLLIETLINGSPDDRRLLVAGARLHSAYAAVFVEDEARARKMADKALRYARRAFCLERERFCRVAQGPYLELLPLIKETGSEQLPSLYAYALAWALWIQTHSEDWTAVADLPKVEAMLEQVVALDEQYERGDPYLYLGIIRTQLPPALGGKPENGAQAFERAIELSAGKNLMAKVSYAERYARMLFDRPLHDHLLQEVLDAEAQAPGFTLSNVLAQQRAQELLQSADEYF